MKELKKTMKRNSKLKYSVQRHLFKTKKNLFSDGKIKIALFLNLKKKCHKTKLVDQVSYATLLYRLLKLFQCKFGNN